MLKKILIVVGILILIGGSTVYILLNKPHRDVNKVQAITIKADELAKDYNKDEKAADAKYLNKAIEVTGTIGELEKNQDGGVMSILKTEDSNIVIQCAMVDKNCALSKGQVITIKGFCSGNGITGISLTGCEVKKP